MFYNITSVNTSQLKHVVSRNNQLKKKKISDIWKKG